MSSPLDPRPDHEDFRERVREIAERIKERVRKAMEDTDLDPTAKPADELGPPPPPEKTDPNKP